MFGLQRLFDRWRNKTTQTAKGRGTMENTEQSSYLLPPAALDRDRLHFQHYFLRLIFKGNYLAPLHMFQVKNILDVGTGTGIWALEIAEAFPAARVIGIDINLPTPLRPPPTNCQFVQGDVIAGLAYPDDCFEYTHQRLLVAAIKTAQWPGVIKELLRVTRPHGFVEMIEASPTFEPQGPATRKMLGWWSQTGAALGFDASIVTRLDELLWQAGLTNIQKREFKVPLGKGREGKAMGQDLVGVFRGIKKPMCATLKIDPDEFDRVLAVLPEEWNQMETTQSFYVYWGQKGVSR